MLTHLFVSGFYPFSFRIWFLLKLKCFWDKYHWEVLSGPEKVGFECNLSWVIGMKEMKETWKYEILNFKKNKIRYWLEAGGPITAPPVHLPLDLFVHNVSMKMKVKVRSVLRDGGAWWAAICGVARSRTRLKWLSSSSSSVSIRGLTTGHRCTPES